MSSRRLLSAATLCVSFCIGLSGCSSENSTAVATAPVVYAATATLSATSLSYPSITLGTSGGIQVVSLTNSGNTTLTGVATSLAGNAAFTDTTNCTATLAAGANCTVSVLYSPTVTGTVTGTFTFTDSLGTQTVSISGSAFAGTCTAITNPTGTTAGVPLKLTVLSGVAPVVGASVQLYAAGTTGLGIKSTALLASPLIADSTGSVTVAAGYTFPSLTSQIYAVASGGKVGSLAANSGIVMMTALGTGSKIVSNSLFIVNEVTTVSAAYALSQFLATGGLVGATSTNATGIANAFSTAASLACSGSGASPGGIFPTNGASPATRIYSLANFLNTCTAGTVSNACSQLFAYATPAGGTAPANTLDATFNLARNPALNIANIYTQSTQSSAFSPALANQPDDWTLFVTFSGGGMNSPSGLGIDSLGNVRVANYFNVASAFSPIGAPIYTNGVTGSGLDASYGLAVDASNNAWIPNEPGTMYNASSVSVINLAGASVAGSTGYTAGGLNYPLSVAIDPNTTAWVVDYGNSHVTLLSSAGVPVSGTSGYTTPLFAFPVAVALDGNHVGWIANQSSNTVTKVLPDGSAFTNFACCNGASGIAVDQKNNVWVANYYGASVSEISSAGAIVSNQAYTAGGNINHPQGIALDGAGNVWVTNFRAPYLTELAGATASVPGAALSPSPGYASDAGLLEAYALAIDASGDIWISNFGSNTVTEFVGIAVPVKTPLLGIPSLP